jgi:hypothetical protein
LGGGGCSADGQPVIYRISLDGSSATLIRGILNNYRAYNLIKDGDGNYVLIGFYNPDEGTYLLKIDPSGNVITLKKRYTANNGLRFYNIALDLDGNYLLAGVTKIGSTYYPIAVKINKNDNSVIWARRWSIDPIDYPYSPAKGIIPVKLGKILVSGYLGTSTNNYNGFFAILDSADCMTPFQVNVNDTSLYMWYPSISLLNYSGSDISNLTLTPYNFSISQTASCSLSDNEYKSCNYIIYGSKGFIAIKSENEVNLKIFSISGYKVKEVNIKEGKIKINPGIYIVQIGKDKVKIIVK